MQLWQKLNRSSHFFAAITVSVWATVYPLSKIACEHFTPGTLGTLRNLIAALLLVLFGCIKKIGLPKLKDLPVFFFNGLMGFALYLILFNTGNAMLSSATSSLIIAMVPVITAVLATFTLKEKILPRAWLAIALELAGLVILLFWDGELTLNRGILWVGAAAILFSIYSLCTRYLSRRYGALQITTYTLCAAAILMLPFVPQAVGQLMTAGANQLAGLFMLAVVSSGCSFVWWSKALALSHNTSSATNYMFLTPFLASLFGYLLLQETLTLSVAAGGLVIISGLLLFARLNRTAAPTTATRPSS